MLAQTRQVHLPHAALAHAGRDDEVERPFEAPELDRRRLRQRFGALERRDRGVWVGGRILPGLDPLVLAMLAGVRIGGLAGASKAAGYYIIEST